MKLAASPHAHILLAPWRQRHNEKNWWGLGLIVATSLLPSFLLLKLKSPEVGLLAAAATLAVQLQGAWLMQFASLQRQNHPTAARLVPGHLQRLREAMLGLWLLISVASGLLLGNAFDHGLAWGLAAAALMLLTAVMMRHPLLWALFWIVPSTSNWWIRSAPWRWLRGEAIALYQQQPVLLAVVALLVLAWLLSQMLRAGSTPHRVAYAEVERVRLAVSQAARGGSTLRYQGRLGAWLVLLFCAPYRSWMHHLLATARPTERSAMARLELAFGAGAHWTAQALAAVLLIGAGLLAMTLISLLAHVETWSVLDAGKFGLTIGVTSFAVNPVMALRNSLYNSRREQALLMLLPGMPRGAALNRRLARRQLLQALSTWLLALVTVAGLLRGHFDDPVFAYVWAGLPASLLLLRDWTTLSPPGSSNTAMPILLLLVAGASLYAAARWLQLPPTLMAAVIVPLTVGVGLWRWQRLGRYPQALPVGRLAR